MLYADTSALLPYYRQEASSVAIEELFLAQSEPVIISELCRVEFASALSRWVRTGELTEPQANRVESAFHDDVAKGCFRVTGVGVELFQRAQHWLLTRRTSLRTLDALQLACAQASGAQLVTLDHGLYRAADYLGIRTYNVGAT